MKQRLQEPRFDFSGGLNLRQSPDFLQTNELVRAENIRLSSSLGALVKRSGSRRMHDTPLAGPVLGLAQWSPPGSSAKQLVAVAGGNLYTKGDSFQSEFSQQGSGLSSSLTPSLETARVMDPEEGALLRLYLADGKYWRWDGVALEEVESVDPSPDLIIQYNTRMFFRDPTFPQNVIWGVLGDPEDTTPGLREKGGDALVQTLRGQGIVAWTVVGSSLVICTPNAVARFTGYSPQDVQLHQDTEGISADHGPVGRQALARVEGFAALLDSRGPHAVTESAVQPVGPQVESALAGKGEESVVAYHPGRREVWWAVQEGEDPGPRSIYILSMGVVQAWSGPFRYPFTVRSLLPYEDEDGEWWLVAGCEDGFVRHLDTGSLDDVERDGSGGEAYTARAQLAPLFFEIGPHHIKSITRLWPQVDLPAGKRVELWWKMDGGPWDSEVIYGNPGAGIQDYRVDVSGQGKRLLVEYRDSSRDLSSLHGLVAEAFDMQRG